MNCQQPSEVLAPPYPDSGTEKLRCDRARWDSIALAIPDLFPAFSTQYYRRCEISLIQRWFGDLAGKRVLKLDLWNEAVNTRILQWIESQGALAHGIDLSFLTASRAHRNCRQILGPMHLLQADIRHLPYQDDSFDLVYTMGTIEHVAEYQSCLEEIGRVLRKGGRAIVGVPHRWNIFLRPLVVRALDFFEKYPYSPEKTFSSGELRRAVEKAGLRVQGRTGLLAFPGIIRMADLYCYTRRIPLHKLTPSLLWPFEFMERRFEFLRKFGYMLVLVAEKP